MLKFDKAQFTSFLSAFSNDAVDFYETIRQHRVIPADLTARIQALIEAPLPIQGLGIDATIACLKKDILPGLAHTAGPRAFPWVIGGVTPAAFVGALYQILYDQINMVSGASIGPKLENETIKLLLDLFQLSRDAFEGNFTTGATASNLCALAIARQWCGEESGINIANEGVRHLPALEVYAATPHASIGKALAILGMGRNSLVTTPTLAQRESIDLEKLAALLAASAAPAKIVVASAGTVNTGDFDDLLGLKQLCIQYNAWLHVDAAFGLFARCSPRHANLITGIELADSITADGHKWLNVPYDCGILFLKKAHKRYQIAAFSSVADYMSQAADEPMNKGIENSRALRALPAWATLKAYGQAGYTNLVQRNCVFAEKAGALISAIEGYALLTPVRLNIVLFHAKAITTPEENAQLLQAINDTGKIFITATVYAGKPALRIAVCNWQTEAALDLEAIHEALLAGLNYKKDQ